MSDEPLPRRELLSSLATVGTIGAFSGAGSAALYADHELFAGNLLTAGELDLGVCWERPGEDCTPTSETATIDFGTVNCGDSGTATIRCALRDNPGWLWFRSNCPDDACGLERKVKVTMWYDEGCDGDRHTDDSDDMSEQFLSVVNEDGDPESIHEMSLCRALSLLHEGILLDGDPFAEDGGEIDPLDADEECCIGFEWFVADDDCICEDDTLELTFEFHTEQRRHVPEPTNPWADDPACEVDCDDTDDCAECPDFQGISFVAFCVEDGGIDTGAVSFTPYFDVEGEAFRVDWQSDEPLSEVVLFYANQFEVFSGGTIGSATVGEGEMEERCGDNLRSPSNPCRGTNGCGVKYEFDEDRWEDVCETPLNCGGTGGGGNGGTGGSGHGGNGGGGNGGNGGGGNGGNGGGGNGGTNGGGSRS